MIYSVATENDVGFPKCQERFEILPEFYEQVAECPECSVEFVIKPPGTPSYQAAVPAKAVRASDSSKKKLNPMVIRPAAAIVLLLVILIIVIALK